MIRNPLVLLLLAIILVVLIVALFRLLPGPDTPWDASGTLAVVVRAVPSAEKDLSFGFGIDNMTLHTTSNDKERASTLTKRVLFAPGDNSVQPLFETNMQTGSYSGLTFKLTSPELRNAWEQDEAPGSVTLLHQLVDLPATYEIEEDETTVIILGFETFQALHKQNEVSVYLPVIQVETRGGASVTTSEQGHAVVAGGTILSSTTYGMDNTGRMRLNFREKALP